MADPASTDDVADAVESILGALARFNRFEGPDRAVPRSAWLPLIDEDLPTEGAGREAVLELVEDVVVDRGLRNGHPGFTGWVTTAPSDVAVAADLAQTVAASQRWWVTPGNHLDSMAVEWMVQLLGFPATTVGTFTSGGSTANLVGLGVARQHAGERLGLDIAREGVHALPESRIYANEHTHHVVGRAAGTLGLGRAAVHLVPVDADRRTDVSALADAIDDDLAKGRTPIAVVGNAGDVNMGLVDPLGPMAEVAHERDIWFHVDGAYGGFGLLDDRVRERFGDPADYDSFAVDPHKWLAAPVGTGLALCRDADLLGRSFTVDPGSYDENRTVGVEGVASPWESTGRGTPDWGVDFSTPARGIAVWAILKEIGAAGMAARVTRHLNCARRVAERARSSERLELLAEPELSICCFRYVPRGSASTDLDALNDAIVRRLQEDGTHIPSGTRVDGHFAIRPCFINPRTDLDEADALVDAVLAIGAHLET